MKYYLYIAFLLVYGLAQAQSDKPREEESPLQIDGHFHISVKQRITVIQPDSSFFHRRDSLRQIATYRFEHINLGKVVIVAPYKFTNRKERREYLVLRYRVKKVWPYAVLAAKRLTTLRERLNTIESDYYRQQYTKRVQRYIEGKFKDRLQNLTKSQGQILVKLMYRQTGETTYNIIRDLRSGWRAFWYNVTANLFTISLKETYKPYQNKEDYLIEYILRRAFQRNELEYQEPAIPINFLKIMDKWN